MWSTIVGIIAPPPDFDNELREACFEGNVTRALKALEFGGNAESRGETGNSPFHVASYGNKENVSIFFKAFILTQFLCIHHICVNYRW